MITGGTNSYAGINFEMSIQILVDNCVTTTLTTLCVSTAAGSEAMRIDAEGRIGIGTDEPEEKLTVSDAGAKGIRSHCPSAQATDTNKGLRVTNGSDTDTFNVSYKGKGYFAENVGIGTDAPAQKLHVKSTSQPVTTFESTGSNAKIFFASAGSTDNGNYLQQTGDKTEFFTAGTRALTILGDSNVGIGADAPEAKLTIVPGNSAATSIGGRSINYGSNVIVSSGRSGYLVRADNNFTTNNDNSGFQWIYPHDTGGDANYKVFRASAGATLADTFWVSQAGGAYFAGKVRANDYDLESLPPLDQAP